MFHKNQFQVWGFSQRKEAPIAGIAVLTAMSKTPSRSSEAPVLPHSLTWAVSCGQQIPDPVTADDGTPFNPIPSRGQNIPAFAPLQSPTHDDSESSTSGLFTAFVDVTGAKYEMVKFPYRPPIAKSELGSKSFPQKVQAKRQRTKAGIS
jgi:hypothetical protein